MIDVHCLRTYPNIYHTPSRSCQPTYWLLTVRLNNCFVDPSTAALTPRVTRVSTDYNRTCDVSSQVTVWNSVKIIIHVCIDYDAKNVTMNALAVYRYVYIYIQVLIPRYKPWLIGVCVKLTIGSVLDRGEERWSVRCAGSGQHLVDNIISFNFILLT